MMASFFEHQLHSMPIKQEKKTSTALLSVKNQWHLAQKKAIACTDQHDSEEEEEDADDDDDGSINNNDQFRRAHSSSPIHPIPAQPLTSMADIDHLPLPHDWEKFLNPKTGETFYINWSTCKKALHDPRELQRLADERIRSTFKELFSLTDSMENTISKNFNLEEFSETSHKDHNDSADDTDDELDKSDPFPGCSTETISKVHKLDTTLNLVVMGCRTCLVYILCPAGTLQCSSCGASLLNLNDASEKRI